MTTQRLTEAEANAFPATLRTVVGSEVHGTGLPGLGDIDHMAIGIEDEDCVLGVGTSPETWMYRTAWTGEANESNERRSSVGDLDLTIYPARKWARLALNGNPSALAPIFVEERFVLEADEFGRELRANADRFMSRHLGTKHIGYMKAQRERLMGERSNRVSRPELVDAHGFDVKFAAHMLRLGYQGTAVLRDHILPIPLPTDIAEYILSVRRGERTLEEVLAQADDLEQQMEDALATTTLPDEADSTWVNGWLARAQTATWASRGAGFLTSPPLHPDAPGGRNEQPRIRKGNGSASGQFTDKVQSAPEVSLA